MAMLNQYLKATHKKNNKKHLSIVHKANFYETMHIMIKQNSTAKLIVFRLFGT